jgi:hypothetical protein
LEEFATAWSKMFSFEYTRKNFSIFDYQILFVIYISQSLLWSIKVSYFLR